MIVCFQVVQALNEYETPAEDDRFDEFQITESIPSDGQFGCKYTYKAQFHTGLIWRVIYPFPTPFPPEKLLWISGTRISPRKNGYDFPLIESPLPENRVSPPRPRKSDYRKIDYIVVFSSL